MAAPTPADLADLLGEDLPVSDTQAGAVLAVVTELARSYCRGAGFDTATGEPLPDVGVVVLLAAARLISHPRQHSLGETLGPQASNLGQGFSGWSLVEQAVLHRYRVRAQ